MLPGGSWASPQEQAFLMPQPHVAFTSVSGTLPRLRPLISALFRRLSWRRWAFSSSWGRVHTHDLAAYQVCSQRSSQQP